jgi:hypothetical protein
MPPKGHLVLSQARLASFATPAGPGYPAAATDLCGRGGAAVSLRSYGRCVAHAIDWATATVHLTEQAKLVLTVRIATDPVLILQGEGVPNPIWRQKFTHAANARRHEWQARSLHWGMPAIDREGMITVSPIDGSTLEGEFLRSELDDLVKRANELEGGDWVRLEREAQELTDLFRSRP